MAGRRILRAGKNCWRIARADRFSLLLDGEAYFHRLREQLIQARESIRILAWDIDSRVELVREPVRDGWPTRLGDLLLALLEARPQLEIHILLWEAGVVYGMEREWDLPFGGAPWHHHPRLHLVKDDHHPLAGSQHQKVVIIDGAVAFTGGLDITRRRWDSTRHLARDPRRRDPAGMGYPPFHDVQAMMDGPVVSALDSLVRDRWQAATGDRLSAVAGNPASRWPADLQPDWVERPVALARTLPAFAGHRRVREVERLFLDAIRRARRYVYIESQYLTSRRIQDALTASLRRKRGPEIVMILPKETEPWIEHYTMDVLRARVVGELWARDRHHRLRILYPSVTDSGEVSILVHSKVMIVDDRLVRVGSANLSNRSMGLDSECDVALELNDGAGQANVRRLLARLLGHHLGRDEVSVLPVLDDEPDLITAIERLEPVDDRRLTPLSEAVDADELQLSRDPELFDPDHAPGRAELVRRAIGRLFRSPLGGRMRLGLGLLAIVLLLAALWQWTPLARWGGSRQLAELLRGLADAPNAWAVALAIFVVGGLLAIPISSLTLACALVFGPQGIGIALTGGMISAIAGYGAGAYLGKQWVREMAGERVQAMSRFLARRGIVSVMTVRLVPVAPFMLINLMAGASHIAFRDYLVGTLLGLIPGIVLISVFGESLVRVLQESSLRSFLWAAVAVIGAIVLALLLVRRKWPGNTG